MKLNYILIPLLLLILVVGAYFIYPKPKKVPPHFHAGFYVYVDGELQDFSGDEFMRTTYCELDVEARKQIDTSNEKAHLHDNVGDVVHVHKEGTKWIDLFNVIAYHFPIDRSVRGFRDGHEVENILQSEIQPYESIIIVVGDIGNVNLNRYVSVAHIKEVESKTEYCGKN